MPDTPEISTSARPDWACLLHAYPSDGRNWARADAGYLTCGGCYDRFRELLLDIPKRYLKLDPRPGATLDHGSRGAPGFGSRSPGSDHIIAMRDTRSSQVARTWLAGDGRLHLEPEKPPLSVHGVLDTIAWDIAEHRGVDGPDAASSVSDLARWIDRHTDWLTRDPMVVEVRQLLRDVQSQLKPLTGDPGRKHVGSCPNLIHEEDGPRECKAKLYAPLKGDTISCKQCSREWPRSEWERLGSLLTEAA